MTAPRIAPMIVLLALAAPVARADGPAPARKPVAELPEVKKLPDPFAFGDGSPVRTRADWERRRAELKGLFADYEYGHLPPRPEKMAVDRGEARVDAEAHAARQDLTLHLEHAGKALDLHVALTLPIDPKGPVPVIIQGGFRPPSPAGGAAAQPKAKGKAAPRPDRLRVFTDRGYAVAELFFNEVAADTKEGGRSAGIYALFGPEIDCGALMAWAWGVGRVIDAFEGDGRIDRGKVVVTGHSRYGKAALLAGAFDDRIAVTVPSHSGCSGASPYRFIYGKAEQLPNAVGYAPQWFRPDFNEFVGHVDRLPIDQHLLRALVAPRALLSTEGTLDAWTNPEGSQLTYRAAREVYDFLGVPDRISIRFRPVGHVPSNEDLLDFADHIFAGKSLPPEFGQLAYPEEKAAFDWNAPR